MKVKNGKYKLEKNDIRVGNFVLSVEEQHIKVQDLNKFFTLRFHKRMPVGIWLDSLIKRGDEGKDSLKTYIAVIWSVLSVIPDSEYMQALVDDAQEGLERHPEWYGKKKEDGQEVPHDGQE